MRDLPGPYRAEQALVTILPVQEVAGANPVEVSRRLDRVLDRLQTEGVGRGAPRQRRASA